MSEVLQLLNLLNDIVFVSLVNTTLQMAVIITLIALIIWLFRLKSATTRHALWLFAVFSIVALPFITPFISSINLTAFHQQEATDNLHDGMMRSGKDISDIGGLSGADSVVSTGTVKTDPGKEMELPLINPVSVAYFIWCAGVLFMLWVTAGSYWSLRKIRVRAFDVQERTTFDMLSQLKQKLGITKSVSIKVSSEIYTPMSFGIIHPTIILPDSVIDSPSSELEMILTHELAHIRRHDYLVNLLQNMLGIVFFFHPLFHLMNHSLTKEREHICDDWVIHTTRQRVSYARCIVSLLENALHKPVNVSATIAMAEHRRDVPGRIEMIVDGSRKLCIWSSRKVLVVMLLICCIALPVIGGIEIIRFAVAKPVSNEGRIVFVSEGNIWTMDTDGRNQKQLTFGRSDWTPAWSTDGRQIAFARWIDDANSWDIHVMNSDGTGIERLTEGPETDIYPTWSPDSQQIMFQREVWEQKDGEQKQKSWSIYLMNKDGANVRSVGEIIQIRQIGDWASAGGRPTWAPDGARIAYFDWPVDRPAVCVIDIDGKNQKTIYDWGGDYGLDWSNEDKIVFCSAKDSWNNWRATDIYVIEANGENLKRLTQPSPVVYKHVKWSSDGTKIVFSSNQDGNWDIYTMNADGSNIQQLTNTLVTEGWPDWSGFSYAIEPTGKLRSTWGKIKEAVDF